MNAIVLGILLGIASFFALQMVLPFPYGLVIWFIILWLIIRYAKKYTVIQKDSVLNYRRIDPINEKEKNQNDEALRILEKKYIEDVPALTISSEERVKAENKTLRKENSELGVTRQELEDMQKEIRLLKKYSKREKTKKD